MNATQTDRLAAAVLETFRSPNECDRNFEPANVVDGLFAIARAIDRLAAAVSPNHLVHPGRNQEQ